MKPRPILLFVLFVFTSVLGITQNDSVDKPVQDILKLERDSIIRLGFSSIQPLLGENATIDQFDKIVVSANKKSVWVSFLYPIKYIPLYSVNYYDISVDIVGKQIVYGPLSNPLDYLPSQQNISFCVPSADSEKNIQFVINAINKKASLTVEQNKKTFIENLNGTLTIRENKNYFAIESISETVEALYKIDKGSGKIYDEQYNPLVPPPEDENMEDKLKEIK